jgi:hypothetical protein
MTADARAVRVGENLGLVTVLALDIAVLAEQREACQIVIKERCVFPNGLVVAIAALRTELAVMRIVVRMTGITAGQQFCLEYRLNMAIDAACFLMPAKQPVVRIRVMIEKRLGPGIARMAGVTLVAAVAVVLVILEMAGRACHIHLVLKWILGMAVAACQLGMFEEQLEIGVTGVIETRVAPVGRVMAIFTLLAGAALVNVVIAVTGEAGRRRVLMRLVFVAVPAFHLTMLADQREVRRVVIERRVDPVIRVVTVAARGAEIALVNVVVAVAIGTFTGRITTPGAGFVAVGAGRVEMFAEQLELGECMVKCGFVETENVGVTTLVIGMAVCAGAVSNLGRSAVKSSACTDATRDILVAVEA